MWWHTLLIRLGVRVARKTLRDDREELVRKLTAGSFTPMQQVLLNYLISKIIDKYIEEESVLDYFPGNYFRYIKKLKAAKKLIECVFAIINIVKFHKRDSDDFSFSYTHTDSDVKFKKAVEIKDDIMREVDKLLDMMDLQSGDDPEEINIAQSDIDKAVKKLI